MARLEDLHQRMQEAIIEAECPHFEQASWAAVPSPKERRVAIISSAGLVQRGEPPMLLGESGYRAIPNDIAPNDLLMSHISVNFDRTGFIQDANVAFPRDRLRELAEQGTIGTVADTHYSFMGATEPAKMEAGARELAGRLKAEGVNTAVLLPV